MKHWLFAPFLALAILLVPQIALHAQTPPDVQTQINTNTSQINAINWICTNGCVTGRTMQSLLLASNTLETALNTLWTAFAPGNYAPINNTNLTGATTIQNLTILVSAVLNGNITLNGLSAMASATNNAGLSSVSTSLFSQVTRLGYASAGDAPVVTYIASGSACSLNAGAGDGGSQVPSSDGKCWIATLQNPADIKIWGVSSDTSATKIATNTPAMQNAANASAANGYLLWCNETFYVNTIQIPAPAVSIMGPDPNPAQASSHCDIRMATNGATAVAAGGGSLTAGTYFVRVYVLDGSNNVIGVLPIAAGVTLNGSSTNAITVTYPAFQNAASYNVWFTKGVNVLSGSIVAPPQQTAYFNTAATSLTITTTSGESTGIAPDWKNPLLDIGPTVNSMLNLINIRLDGMGRASHTIYEEDLNSGFSASPASIFLNAYIASGVLTDFYWGTGRIGAVAMGATQFFGGRDAIFCNHASDFTLSGGFSVSQASRVGLFLQSCGPGIVNAGQIFENANNVYADVNSPRVQFPIINTDTSPGFGYRLLGTNDLVGDGRIAGSCQSDTTQGTIASLGTITPGIGGTPGTYTGVALTGGNGYEARGTIVVNGDGTVHSGGVTLTDFGYNYLATDSLSATPTPIPTGFAVAISTVACGDIQIGNAPETLPALIFVKAVGASVTPNYNVYFEGSACTNGQTLLGGVSYASPAPYTTGVTNLPACLSASPGYIIPPPTSCSGLPTGTLWNNSGVANICP